MAAGASEKSENKISLLPLEFQEAQLRRQLPDQNLEGIRGSASNTIPVIDVQSPTNEPSESQRSGDLTELSQPLFEKTGQAGDGIPIDTSVLKGTTQLIGVGGVLDGEPDSPLDVQLSRALQKSVYDDGKYFLPTNRLQQIVRSDTVQLFLNSKTKDNTLHLRTLSPADIAKYVCGSTELGSAQKLFAILVRVGKIEFIEDFYLEGLSDRDLPFAKHAEVGATFQLARRKGSSSTPIKSFERWEGKEIEFFEQNQWYMLSPYFNYDKDGKPSFYDFDNRIILPWIHYDKKSLESNFSEVRRVKVHHAHHGFEPNSSFALKTLKSPDNEEDEEKQFRSEVEALKKLSHSDHLVTFFTAFRHSGKYHLLFRWADGGNLIDMWEIREPEPEVSHQRVRWFGEQCHGLAEGLRGIHNTTVSVIGTPKPHQPSHLTVPNTLSVDDKDCGRHGDIKPQNVLWFRQDPNQYGYGVLKISDFGLTTFHSAFSTKVLPVEVAAVSQTYMAPEHALNQPVSRPYDIWSLGCIYLEFISWILLGKQGVEHFRILRKSERTRKNWWLDNFYNLHKVDDSGQTTASVKRSINIWIEYLQGLVTCSKFFSDFLRYIQTRMIVVETSKRDTCAAVCKRLGRMYLDCERKSDYCLPPEAKNATSTQPKFPPLFEVDSGSEIHSLNPSHNKEVRGKTMKQRVKRLLRLR